MPYTNGANVTVKLGVPHCKKTGFNVFIGPLDLTVLEGGRQGVARRPISAIVSGVDDDMFVAVIMHTS